MANNSKLLPPEILKEFKNHPQCYKAVNCQCFKYNNKCGDRSCQNREMGVECVPPCISGCGNQRIRKGVREKYLIKKKEGVLGFGVQAGEEICKGEIVAEYRGTHKRIQQYQVEQNIDKTRRLYAIESVEGFVIDCSENEYKAKYINESCVPNLGSVCFIVDQIPRIILVAIRHIRKGEFLGYKYRLDPADNLELYECECGKRSCKKETVKIQLPKLHKCTICDRSYSYLKNLQAHMKKSGHGEVRRFPCNICDQTFTKRFQLLEHSNMHHKFLPNVQLSDISKTLGNGYKSKTQETDQSNNVLICPICQKVVKNKKSFKQHALVHQLGSITCHICERKYKQRKNYELHMMTHEDTIQMLKCKGCHRRFYRKCDLVKHEKLHKMKKYKCGRCPMSYDDMTNLENHLLNHDRDHRKHACVQCQRTFDTKGLLTRHIQLIHPGTILFKCIKCKSGFSSNKGFLEHKKHFHSFGRPSCPICKLDMYSKQTLLEHMKLHRDGRKSFECVLPKIGKIHKLCKKVYKTNCGLMNHIRRDH